MFECYGGPVVDTHSNVRRVTGHHRNLTEKQIREIVRRGGVDRHWGSAVRFTATACGKVTTYTVIWMCSLFAVLMDTVCFGTDFDARMLRISDTGVSALYGYLARAAGDGLNKERNVIFEAIFRGQ